MPNAYQVLPLTPDVRKDHEIPERCQVCDFIVPKFLVVEEQFPQSLGPESTTAACRWCTASFFGPADAITLTRDEATDWATRHLHDWDDLLVTLVVADWEAQTSDGELEFVGVNLDDDFMDENEKQSDLLTLSFPEGWETFELWNRKAS